MYYLEKKFHLQLSLKILVPVYSNQQHDNFLKNKNNIIPLL